MVKRRQSYESDDIIVTFDPDVCIHSGVCVMGLPDVFDIKRKRWVRPELQPADVVAADRRRHFDDPRRHRASRGLLPRAACRVNRSRCDAELSQTRLHL